MIVWRYTELSLKLDDVHCSTDANCTFAFCSDFLLFHFSAWIEKFSVNKFDATMIFRNNAEKKEN